MDGFEHESLDPYPAALEFVALIDRAMMMVPPARGYLVTELQQGATRAAQSIAVGASEPNQTDQLGFLIEGRRAALRCAVLLDAMNVLKVIPQECRDAGRLLLLQIVERLGQMEYALAMELAAVEKKEKA